MRETGLNSRLRITVRGAVQGVGFRPFVYRLAKEAGLKGWFTNSPQGVFIEVEGPPTALESFLLRLEAERPPRSSIHSLEASWLDPVGYAGFEIRASDTGGARTALVLPDIATCPDCLGEIFDPHNRRCGYPFTNCTNCGPRFSIIESLPYDRANTSMKRFAMCPQCQAEYDDPLNRRFHAQPNACPVCGPQLEVWDRKGTPLPALEGSREALSAAAEAILQGKIVAVKGLGGFHLMVAADDDGAVQRLRRLKHREEKPFALMFPSLAAIQAVCEVSPLEERLLRSPEAPIVLLGKRQLAIGNRQLAMSVAPGNPNLGAMLPYTPLHHLLMSALGCPVVATSGNLTDEPICTDEREAIDRLGGIADLFLVHNRPIVRHVDDSIVRVIMGREMVLRRARGYAPLPIPLTDSIGNRQSAIGNVVLALGALLKNTVALAVGSQVFISQHIGDLETDQSFEAFRRVIDDLQSLYEARPGIIAADSHPDYLSTKFARDLARQVGRAVPSAPPVAEVVSSTSAPEGPLHVQPQPGGALGTARPTASDLVHSPAAPRLVSVQHHVAHVLSCMAENELEPPVLGVSWDGTGYGLDGTIWGGEFFLVTSASCERVAHLRPFRLPGGDAAVKEPRRTALGLLYEMFGEAAFDMTDLAPSRAFSPAELGPLKTILARGVNSPLTCSVGRLFDAMASLVGLRQHIRFEGQAAMELEFALRDLATSDEAYEFAILPPPTPRAMSAASKSATADEQPASLILDWHPLLKAVLADLKNGVPTARIAARFHNALAEAIVAVVRQTGQPRVVLSGGCFQNRYLTERSVQRLRQEGLRVYWHQRVPPNDGGIALGQVLAALRQPGAARPA
jgi:hydrogenase maturation protein HypF